MSDPKRRRTDNGDASELRLKSRQSYLQKREAEQLALLRRQVAEEAEEEERLGSRLSKAERESFRRNRETLRLAEARNAIDEHLDGYILPDADYSNKSEVLTRRHKEKEKGYEKSEVQLWEDEQTAKVKAQIKRPDRVSADDYDYVFDTSQSIAFVGSPPPDVDKQLLQKQLDEAEQKARTIEETRKSLPVYKFKDEIINAVRDHEILIVIGATGSGKTTQTTQYLAEAGFAQNGRIGCTQPRRVAAMSVAQRVAEEMGSRIGKKAGYTVRFEQKLDPDSQIEYMTEGILLRCLLSDPFLSQYSVIVLDEAHERSLGGDILMALLKEVTLARKDFRLVVASATLDVMKVSKYFRDAPLLSIPGLTFPVEKLFSSAPEANYLNAAVTTIFQIHLSQGPGDILVFLTGEEEITLAQSFCEDTMRKLGSRAPPLILAPVYGALPAEAQQLIFQPTPPGSRKVVLSTNIAETSLTIDGIKFVIDSGFTKEKQYNARTGQDSLVVVPTSRASAEQRAGRAGRTGPGMAFRLYTKYAFYNELPESQLPEILRVNLDGPVLMLKALGIQNLLEFDFMDPPSPENLCASLESLYALGFLTDSGEVSKLGRRATELPLDPRLAKALLAADQFGCVDEMISLVSMVSEASSLFFAPKDKKVAADHARMRFSSEHGDLISFLKIWNEFEENECSPLWCKENFIQYRSLNRVRDVRDQLSALCDKVEIVHSSSGMDHLKILKAFTSGYFANVARLNRDGQSYRTVKSGLPVYIHPSSCLREKRPRLVVYYEQVLTTKEWMRSVSPIEPTWLSEVAPHYFKKSDIDNLDVGKKMPKERAKTSTG